MIGKQIAHYTVTAKLGEGGMGAVYRATDPKLKRDVALKVLPFSFAEDQDRLARFRREAEVLASLSHANIGAIFGLEESDASQVLVLELIEGEDLAQRIQRGPLPVAEAVGLALQIAEALEAAHERGIVHRDLKPANIKITPEDQVKVLDFGLAKAVEEETTADAANSPTLTMQATQAGMILGTAAYMSPEQARGKPTDRRTDIWAFGVVLFEMLCGEQAFQGEDVSMILASVLKHDLNWSRLPADLPKSLEKTLRRCLDPNLRSRFQAIGDVRYELEHYRDETGKRLDDDPTRPQRVVGPLIGWVVAALVLLGWLVTSWGETSKPTPAAITQLSLSVEPTLETRGTRSIAVSRDGRILAFTGQNREGLYVQRLDVPGQVRIPGTQGATSPFFSPDGQWIGYFVPGQALMKVSLRGGDPLTICPIDPNPHGGAWGPGGKIVFSAAQTGLFVISEHGGEPIALTEPQQGEYGHRWPSFLPGGESVLMTRRTRGEFEETRIERVFLADGRREVLVQEGAYDARFASGHLVFMRGATLLAAPYDPDSGDPPGTAVPFQQRVTGSIDNLGAGQFGVSDRGDLVYLTGSVETGRNLLVQLDREGALTTLSEPMDLGGISLAPDGTRVALTISDGRQQDIWIQDLKTQARSRLTFNRTDDFSPVWTPDSRQVIFTSRRAGSEDLFIKAADAGSEAEQLTTDLRQPRAGSVSPDSLLAISVRTDERGRDIYVLDLEGGALTPMIQGPFREDRATISPDGRWLAYRSMETGRSEIYVRPFPEGPGQWQVSDRAAGWPAWSPGTPELLFYAGGTLHVVPYEVSGGSFRAGRIRQLLQTTADEQAGRIFDVTPDGQHLIIIVPAERTRGEGEVVLVQNWVNALSR